MSNISLAPLFEKLLDEDTEIVFENTPKSLLTFKELQRSLIDDISRLLNTRLSFFWKDHVNSNHVSPFTYGVDITAAISTEDVVQMRELEIRIENALQRFESRLIEPKVSVQQIPDNLNMLFVNIDGHVMIENRRALVSFPISVNMNN